VSEKALEGRDAAGSGPHGGDPPAAQPSSPKPDSGVPGTQHADGPVYAEKDPSPGLDIGQAEVQEKFDKLEEDGFLGTQVDPTPNENYSMETPPDAPTPETDPELAAKARAAVDADRTPMSAGSPTPQVPDDERSK